MSRLKQIPLSDIEKPKVDARTSFAEGDFAELVQSIKINGLIEPIIVRPLGNDKYEIVAGSRRFLATRDAGFGKIEAVIRSYDDSSVEAVRLDENLVREDLNQVDVARYIERLMQAYNLTQDAVAERIHRTKGYVSQMMSLLHKDVVIRDMVEREEITSTVGRELLRVPNEDSRHRLARYAKSGGANSTTVRNWVNRELTDANRQAGEFVPPEQTTEAPESEQAVAVHPCRACGRIGPLDAMMIIRACPECGDAIEQAIEGGAFKVEPQPEQQKPEPEPTVTTEPEVTTPVNSETKSNPGGNEVSPPDVPQVEE